jgi:hypothetical protein
MLRTLCLMGLVAFSCVAGAAIYKWTDDDGVVQYSATPPPGRAHEEVKGPPPPPSAPEEEATNGEDTAAAGEDGEQAQSTEDESPADDRQAKIEANCAQARENLKVLMEHPRVVVTDPDTGESSRLTEEERQAQLTQTQKDVDYYCNE